MRVLLGSLGKVSQLRLSFSSEWNPGSKLVTIQKLFCDFPREFPLSPSPADLKIAGCTFHGSPRMQNLPPKSI
jgi:hypothetical protein